MSDKKPREFWIEFDGDPSFDQKGHLRYVTSIETESTHGIEAVHVREVMPDEPDYKALCEQLMGALAKIRKENEFFSDSGVMDWDNVQEIAFKALEQAKKVMGEK